MLSGVFSAKKKNGEIYYRSSITFQNKHISLGSFSTEQLAHDAYTEAGKLLTGAYQHPIDSLDDIRVLPFSKMIVLLNFKNNGIYIPTPIYLHQNYFSYYFSRTEEYKFDIDDLFYYSSHRILRRNGHLYVNDYGMQYSILNRYGIHAYSVAGKDYLFVNGDPTDFRYSNIKVINKYFGVERIESSTKIRYRATLHIRSNYVIGTYESEAAAAAAYNKAVDLAKQKGIQRNFPVNYITELSASEYAKIYTEIRLSPRFLAYLESSSASHP